MVQCDKTLIYYHAQSSKTVTKSKVGVCLEENDPQIFKCYGMDIQEIVWIPSILVSG